MNLMRNKQFLFFIMFLAVVVVGAFIRNAHAETRYVSDILVITLRSEPEKDSEVLKTLRSNTPLEIIEETERYLKVRTEQNQEGWVVKRYITSNIPKPMVITELGEKISSLEIKLETLEKTKIKMADELRSLKENRSSSIGEYKATMEQERKESQKMSKELSLITEKYNQLLHKSQNVVEMSKKIKDLEKNNIKSSASEKKCKETSEKLMIEKKELLRAGIIRWFLAGSGVLLAGIILGKISRKKDYY